MTSPQRPDSSTAPADQNPDIDIEGTEAPPAAAPAGDIEPTLTTDDDAQRDDLPVKPGNS